MSDANNGFYRRYVDKLNLGKYELKPPYVPRELSAARGTLDGRPTAVQRSINLSALPPDFASVNPLVQQAPTAGAATSLLAPLTTNAILKSLGKSIDNLRIRQFVEGLKDVENARKRTSGASDDPPGTHKISLPSINIPSP